MKTGKKTLKMPYMTGSINWNKIYSDANYPRTREPIKVTKNRAAYKFIEEWADKNCHKYMDDEAMRTGGDAYGPYEMRSIAEHAFMMGRLYGRTERAEEKNKEIKKFQAKIKRLQDKIDGYRNATEMKIL